MVFKHRESYKHRFCKVVLEEWFSSGPTNISVKNYDGVIKVPKATIVFEYPVGLNYKKWSHGQLVNGINVPTYDECDGTIAGILDAAVFIDGDLKFGLEVCHTNPVSEDKSNKLNQSLGSIGVIVGEIEANWIMNQIGKPKKVKFSKLIVGTPQTLKPKTLRLDQEMKDILKMTQSFGSFRPIKQYKSITTLEALEEYVCPTCKIQHYSEKNPIIFFRKRNPAWCFACNVVPLKGVGTYTVLK